MMETLNKRKRRESNMSESTEVKTKNKVISMAGTVVTVSIGTVATATILGLATKGLASYLKDMNEVTRTTAAVIGTALLAYAVSGMVVRFAKYLAK